MVFKNHSLAIGEVLKVHKGLFILLINILLLVIVSMSCIIPFCNSIYGQYQQKLDYLEKIEALEGFAKRHPKYDQEMEKLKLRHISFREKLPRQISTKVVISKIQRLADSSGIIMSAKVLPQKNASKQSLMQIRINLKLEGDYFSLLNFFKSLEEKSLALIENLCIDTDTNGMLKASGIYIQCVCN